MKKDKKFSFYPISLGCFKNQVDLEFLLGKISNEGHRITDDLDNADFVLLNTCSFINESRMETERIAKKISGNKRVIMLGCYVQMFQDICFDLFPNIDLFFGTESGQFYKEILNNLDVNKKILFLNKNKKIFHCSERFNLNRFHTYIKISEGCSRKCSFCRIPQIRGKLRSRRLTSILDEVKILSEKGFTEFELIAEDTSLYGIDLYGKRKIMKLMESLDKNFFDKKFRLLYVYPDRKNILKLAKHIKELNTFIKYIDVPFQHVSKNVLETMKREYMDVFEISEKIKSFGLILRSSFIVGYPSETKKDFDLLKDFIKKGYVDKLGLFIYSDENPKIKDLLSYKTKMERYNEIIKINRKIAYEKMKMKTGKYHKAIFYYSDKKFSYGRLMEDSPEIDDLLVSPNLDIEKFKLIDVLVKDVKNFKYLC